MRRAAVISLEAAAWLVVESHLEAIRLAAVEHHLDLRRGFQPLVDDMLRRKDDAQRMRRVRLVGALPSRGKR